MAHLVYGDCSDDAVGGNAGSAGESGVSAWLERAALRYGDAVSAIRYFKEENDICVMG